MVDLKIEVSFPNMKLSSNSTKGNHWSTVAWRRKCAREQAFYECKMQGVKKLPDQLVDVRVTFHQPDKRNRNADNIISAFKSQQDGIADAIGIPDEHWIPSYHLGRILDGGKTVIEISSNGMPEENAG